MVSILDSVAGNTSGIFTSIGKFAQVTMWGLIALGVVYIIVYFLRFKHPMYLFIEEGNGIRLKKDRGEKNKKKRTFKALKNKDIDFPYPETKYEINEGKRSILCAYVKNQSATWLTVSDNEKFIPADYDMQNKMINDFDSTWNIVKPKESFWDKYGQQVLWVGSLGIFLVVIILILKRMDKIIEMGNSAALAQAAAGKQVLNYFLPALLWRFKKNETN